MAPGLFLCRGQNAEARAGNQGHVVHSAVLVDGREALLFDPGAHWRHGHALRTSLMRQLGLRVTAVVNSHAHPENVLGNAAFADLPIHASARTQQLMRERCEACRERLRGLLGAARMRGTSIVLPTHVLQDGQTWAWRRHTLQVAVFAHAHGQGDLAVFEPDSGTLFAGGLAYRERIPEMQEASIRGWLQALRRLQGWPARLVIGSGVGTSAQTLEATGGYLQALHDAVWQALDAGLAEGAVGAALRLEAWSGWAEYGQRHPLNVQHVWRELEAAWWQTGPTARHSGTTSTRALARALELAVHGVA